MGSWRSKYKVFPKEVLGMRKLPAGMGRYVGRPEKFIKSHKKDSPKETGIWEGVTGLGYVIQGYDVKDTPRGRSERGING